MNLPENTLLSIQDLSIGYSEGHNILFENINLTLQAGELVCFMGPNGIGKSTLIRTLAGLQNPLSGKVTILSSKSDLKKNISPEKISVVLTDKVSAVNMTVHELVTLGRYPYLDWNIKLSVKDREIINRSIELTRIQPLSSKKLYELSDGQLQMTMIARALCQNTPIILLDEPTAHLDLNNRVEIMNLLREICHQQGKSIFVATHELDLALQTADTIWLATHQSKIITGIPEDLVLNGTFDEVFQFKGFDLKTGRISHKAYRNQSLSLSGEGPEYLWTKNALERSGYEIIPTSSLVISIIKETKQLQWRVGDNIFNTLRDLLTHLAK